MNSRILSSNLKIIEEPNKSVKFLNSCDTQSYFNECRLLSFKILLENFDVKLPNRKIYLIISLVSAFDELIDYPVPYFLHCTNKNTRFFDQQVNDSVDFFCMPFENDSMVCELDGFQIVKSSPKQIIEAVERYTINCMRSQGQAVNFETFNNQSKSLEETIISQQKKCRLKFQARIFNDLEKKFENFLTEPVYSRLITDFYELFGEEVESKKSNPMELINTEITNIANLRILRTSRTQGNINGGEEMFLFTTYFDPTDFLVEFFQLNKNGDIGWKSYAKFNKLDCHVNFALVVQTPKYDWNEKTSFEANQKIRVYFRLCRPSSNYYSEKWNFFYVKNDSRLVLSDNKIDDLKIKSLSLNSEKRKIQDQSEAQEDNDLIKKNKILKYEENVLSNDQLEKKNELVDIKSTENKINDDQTMEIIDSKSPQCTNETKKSNSEKLDPVQLQKKLDSYLIKMKNLAERNGQSLLKFAKNRSLHDLFKTQRYLMNFVDEYGNSPLHLSIQYNNFDLVEIFVDVVMTIPHQNIINLRNKAGYTPLLIAAHRGELELCEFFLEANADLSMVDFNGNNPIHLACKQKNIDLLKLLIKYVDKQHNYAVLNAINHEGYAPIHLCILIESFEMVRELLYFKMLRINISDKRVGYSPLHHAVIGSRTVKIAELLIKNEKIDLNSKSYSGCTPLHVAVANRNYLATILLLNKGADPNIQNDVPVHIDYDSMNYLLIRDLKVIEDHLKKKSLNIAEEDNSNKTFLSKELIKLSSEVKKIFEPHLKNTIEMELKVKNFYHNHDPLAYAESDYWVWSFIFLFYFVIQTF